MHNSLPVSYHAILRIISKVEMKLITSNSQWNRHHQINNQSTTRIHQALCPEHENNENHFMRYVHFFFALSIRNPSCSAFYFKCSKFLIVALINCLSQCKINLSNLKSMLLHFPKNLNEWSFINHKIRIKDGIDNCFFLMINKYY